MKAAREPRRLSAIGLTISLTMMMAVPRPARAQPPAAAEQATAESLRQEMERLRAEFEARMAALEARLNAVAGAPGEPSQSPPAPASAAPAAPVPAGADASASGGTLPIYGNAAAASKIFNPDIAAIGDFLGAAGSNARDPGPSLEMHETELTLQAIVDPYARADFFVAIGHDEVDLEEGFLTFPTLPGGILMKVGKMRASFGRMNTQHNHVLPWADRPLMTTNLVGGEEGIGDAGISVARLIPNPWIFLEATGQLFRGSSGDVFHASERGDVSVVGRLRGYHDISESTNLDVGASYARGHNAAGVVDGIDAGRFRTELFGADATIRWRPLQRAIYRSFIGRFEGVISRRGQEDGRQDARGFYVSGDYQFARRWFAGVRYDASERAGAPSARDTGGSLLLTFWPSEFSQVRGQLRRTHYAEGVTANEVLFQFQFSIGAHGAHAF